MSIRILSEVDQFAPWAVKGGTLVVLMKIADAAGDDYRMMWESTETLARRAHMTERNVFNCLRTLEELAVIETPEESEWPPAARLYRSVVRRIRPVSQWIGAADEPISAVGTSTPADVVGMKTLHANSDGEVATTSAGTPEKFSYYPLPITNKSKEIEEATLLPPRSRGSNYPTEADDSDETGAPSRPRKGWDAVQPLRRGGRTKSRRQEAQDAAAAERESDPAYVVAQALASGYPGEVTEAAVADELDDPAPSPRRRRTTRSRRPSERLAELFEREAKRTGHDVPGATNRGALVGTFGHWMADGTDYAVIRTMVETYWEDSWQRSDSAPAWKDFLAQRGLLTQRGKKVAAVQEVADHQTDTAYWAAQAAEDPHRYDDWGKPTAN